MIAFLIDADNSSSPAWVDEAFKTIEANEGSIAIRRTKCIPIECSKISIQTQGIAPVDITYMRVLAKHYPAALL